MTEENNNRKAPASQRDQETDIKSSRFPIVGIREKLIIIFLLAKVIPLILLAVIAWQALVALGTILRETSVTDSKEALTALAVENIERLSTDTAQKVAEFLYQRDADIVTLARYCDRFEFERPEGTPHPAEKFLEDYCASKTSRIRRSGHWTIAESGMSWVQTDPYIPPKETKKRSVNVENEDVVDGASFHYRPPYGFGDSGKNFTNVPLYDEVALLDKNGRQIAKHVPALSTKKRFRFPEELLNVSEPRNTFVKAEHYFAELPQLGKDGIYVSDVVGAYVPSHFIGMYTPDSMASKRIDAKILELENAADGKIVELSWKLRTLNASLKNEEDKFNSRLDYNKKIYEEIDRRLGKDETWPIEDKTRHQVSAELEQLGFPELAEEILRIPFTPEEEAYAGAENPLGVRFEGIVRWARPVLDGDGEIKGYVTFALNHDHLLEMIDHITPMPERYTELSDAFHGNYAFIWDYQCRSIVHPRHHSICGYNPETGIPETPWLEKTLYDGMLAAGFKREDWQKYIATLTDYVPWTGDKDSPAYQSRKKKPAPELTKMGLVGLDGRYLNNAPQCTGWMDLAKDGGSGSLYILWSGIYKLNTASAIPYYTGQYSPEVRGNRCGFGFVAIGAGIDDFSRPAHEMGDRMATMVDSNLHDTSMHLIVTTAVLSVIVIFIAIWMASYLSNRLQWLIDGITKFRRGNRNFRFAARNKDEFGRLAYSFDEMAESIVNSVHTPLVITDMDLNVIYVNDRCLEVMGGKKQEDVVGKSYKDISIYHYGSECCPITALRKGKDAGKVLYDKWTDSYLQGVANYFLDEHGRKQGYIVTSNDVTEISHKQAELEKAKTEAELTSRHKSNFLARMSHELRTPMNSMIGFNDIIQSKLADPHGLDDHQKLNDYLTHLRQSSVHLLGLLNDILEASNLESGKVVLLEKPLELPKMLDEILEGVRSNCSVKHLELTTRIDELTPSCFLADGLRLRQVLNSLLNNAVKFTPEGGKVDFIVEQKNRENDRSLISFTVRDTGIGISEDKMEMILRPFEQVEAEKGTYTSGSGLGLSIAQKVLELFGSRIAVRSGQGQGSEFSFEVWLREDKASDKTTFEEMKGRFSGQKVLVVDDVRLNRLVLVNLLREAGFIAEEAQDGKEGVEMFEASPPSTYSIVFMDIQMPVMNGYESAAAIRRLPRKDAKTVPIVAISANAFDEDVNRSLASGMNAHYAKPINQDILPVILMNHCTPTDS